MPTYEYACTTCGAHHDVVQSFHDDPLTTCPDCGGPLRKVFGSIGVVFKGSGFYKTDSRPTAKNGESPKATASESKAPEAKTSESKASEATPASGSKSGDTKPSSDSAKASPAATKSSGSSDKASAS